MRATAAASREIVSWREFEAPKRRKMERGKPAQEEKEENNEQTEASDR
jgi:hypothetical protein